MLSDGSIDENLGKLYKEVIDYGTLDLENKDFSAMALYGSGYGGPQCVVLYGAGRCGANVGDADGRGDARIYGALLAGSLDHGRTVPDSKGLCKPLGKYRYGDCLYAAQHRAPS